ncbi:M20/M25/M40 family metallo-hydrolase [Nocardiopsis sp. FIRDI 009]|uniref:M20/M25/M40 family metallo-hydrolase n=1 Tax=Nocardiopsis sp. FIRDI 009 TaxID=714197 RepID=UPI000E273D9A|nr:M20/M25/M40 family metallo-hydrolase [Nocardiopsis sp. FIRDI 009]
MSTARTTDPVALLQNLIRIDTTNPPGDEGACAAYVADLLGGDEEIDVRVIAAAPGRPNVIARFRGRGEAPPLLLHAHSDVVPVTGQDWLHPPFEGRIVDGEVWGRGAIDMKGGLAMMLSALLSMRERGERPAGDVLLAVVADEENGSAVGARHLVERHAELFDGVRYAIGEEAGADIELDGVRFHPVVVAEKRACWLRATLRGPGGHGSRMMPPDTPMIRLARLLGALTGARLPRHTVPAADRMLAELSQHLPGPTGEAVHRLRTDGPHDRPPADLPVEQALYLDSVLRHTVNPTVVRASDKINMVPESVSVDMDGRILPGAFTAADFEAEVRSLAGPGIEFELLLEGSRIDPGGIAEPEFGGFYDTLVGILRKADPDAVPLPMITPASTDNRLFAQLGIRCYGWLPMRLPAGSRHRGMLHQANERVPVDALHFGTECLSALLRDYR